MAVSGGDERHESLVSTLCGLWTRGAGDEVIVSVTNLGRESEIEGALLWESSAQRRKRTVTTMSSRRVGGAEDMAGVEREGVPRIGRGRDILH